MRFLSRHARITLALLCAVLIAARIGGAHLHVCFDGSEPPVSLHLVEASQHHEQDPSGFTHVDQDMSLGGEYLGKKPAPGSDLALLAIACALFLFFLPRIRGSQPDYTSRIPARHPRAHGLPPPRGPPRCF